jgi:hypothetical protein
MNRRRALQLLGRTAAASAAVSAHPLVSSALAVPLLSAPSPAAPPPHDQTQSSANQAVSPRPGQSARQAPPAPVENQSPQYGPDEVRMMDEIEDRGAHYFYECADPSTGLIFDRMPSSGRGSSNQQLALENATTASIAASGFGLSALAVAAQRDYLPQADCEQRMLSILDYFANRAENVHGFFYHYMDTRTGARVGHHELSSIDTALLLCGVYHVREFLNSAKSDKLADLITSRVDWMWMFNGGPTLDMGWTPENGFLKYRWSSYCESTLMFLMAIASPTHPIPARSWDAIERKALNYGGIRFITSYGALFIHQYVHVWYDLRNQHDHFTNYWENSLAATRAHKIFCMLQHGDYSWIDEACWGYSAGDNRHNGYTVWAGPPSMNHPDGTLAPHAAGGSLALLPGETLAVLKTMRERYPLSFTRYGFVDTFRPDPKDPWYDPDVISIDLGLTMLAAENLRTGSIWKLFMKNSFVPQAMNAVGFVRNKDQEG